MALLRTIFVALMEGAALINLLRKVLVILQILAFIAIVVDIYLTIRVFLILSAAFDLVLERYILLKIASLAFLLGLFLGRFSALLSLRAGSPDSNRPMPLKTPDPSSHLPPDHSAVPPQNSLEKESRSS